MEELLRNAYLPLIFATGILLLLDLLVGVIRYATLNLKQTSWGEVGKTWGFTASITIGLLILVAIVKFFDFAVADLIICITYVWIVFRMCTSWQLYRS